MIDTNSLISGLLTLLGTPISKSTDITWGFFITVILIIYFVSTASGK